MKTTTLALLGAFAAPLAYNLAKGAPALEADESFADSPWATTGTASLVGGAVLLAYGTLARSPVVASLGIGAVAFSAAARARSIASDTRALRA